jgi:hypothetical protein
MLQKRAAEAQTAQQPQKQTRSQTGGGGGDGWTLPDFGKTPAPTSRTRRAPAPRTSNRQTVTEAAVKSVVRSVGSSIGRALVRGILGSLTRKR